MTRPSFKPACRRWIPATQDGVKKTASETEIKSAFRKLAKKHHPDQNKTDPRAKERFAEVNTAYEIVGDKAKRRQFDAGEIDADGKPRFQGGPGFEGFGFGRGAPGGPGGGGARTFRWSTSGNVGGDPFSNDDILSEIFGGLGRGSTRQRARPQQQAAPGGDVAVTVTVTLEQLVRGEKARVELPTGRTVDISIPPGTRSGQTIRLRGQGRPGSGPGAPAGDTLVTVVTAPHHIFHVDGDNLRRELSVSLDEAVLGGKVRLSTLDGPVTLTIPPKSTGAGALRLKARGLPKPDGTRGDLLVSLHIILPEAGDTDLEALAKKWRAEKRHAVRDEDAEA